MKIISIGFLLGILVFLGSCSYSDTDSKTQGETTPSSYTKTMENNTTQYKEGESVDEEMIQAEGILEDIIENQVLPLDTSILQTEKNYSFSTDSGVPVVIWPISHATMIVEWGEDILYIDPAEEMSAYEGYPSPTYVFVTHEHGDHYNEAVLSELVTDDVTLIINPAVQEKLPDALAQKAIVMANGDIQIVGPISVEAIPAYNIREEALNYHPKGRDNGYVLETDGFRMYISGDTEDTPEMRALTDIDIAFVSMNLPFTMPIENAASGVSTFAPKTVIPYHFRGSDRLSDVEYFQELVQAENPEINVILHNWYQE